jgi:hypothetical protein
MAINAPMQLPKAVRRVGEQAYWSSQFHANGAVLSLAQFRLFQTALGGTGQGFGAPLTIAETNIREGSRIPASFAYTVDAVALQVYYQDSRPVVYEDVANVTNQGVLSWFFTQTQFEIAPIVLIGAGGGVFGSTADTGGADGANGSREALNNGAGQLWVYRQMPVLLPSSSTFTILLDFGVDAIPVDGGPTSQPMITRSCLLGRFQTAIAIG